jgi:hypothetical protein
MIINTTYKYKYQPTCRYINMTDSAQTLSFIASYVLLKQINILFGDYAILAERFGIAPHGGIHMQFERGKPSETPNAPYRAACIKDERWRSAGPGFEPVRAGPRLSLTCWLGLLLLMRQCLLVTSRLLLAGAHLLAASLFAALVLWCRALPPFVAPL